MKQRTIEKEVSLSGVGLHTGTKTIILFKPLPPNSGIRFQRVDKPECPVIKADVDHLWDIDRGTNLGDEQCPIFTTEHVLAAIHGLGIDNLLIQIDGSEPPVTDGSSAAFVKVLKGAEIITQNASKKFFHLNTAVYHVENGVELVYLPSDKFEISFTIQFNHPFLSSGHLSVEISPKTFQPQLASARTFCFLHEVEELKKRGLIKGGSLENAIVIGDDGIINEEPLRFVDEFVRHKILDLIGDLILIGNPVRGRIISNRSGHASNIRFVKKLKETQELEDAKKGKAPFVFDIRDIQNILPHRYPFLLIDRIVEYEKKNRIVGIKNITANEPFFLGHFPEFPITPGVIIIEAMAQCGAVLLMKSYEDEEDFSRMRIWFLGVDKAKFRRPVIPGDQIRLEVKTIKTIRKTYKMKGFAYVDGELIAEAEMLAALTERELQG